MRGDSKVDQAEDGFESLFNGRDLTGWFATPRVYGSLWVDGPLIVPRAFSEYWDNAPERPAVWTVEDGALVGRQDAPGSGYGGFLVTERDFGDFELVLEANPDWPADTGVMVRKLPFSWPGIQVVVDHRQSGSIGGFYGNGIGGFHAVSFTFDATLDESGRLVALKEDDPQTSVEPLGDKAKLLSYGATLQDFLAAWRPADWNELRIRVVGAKPVITTWVNGTKIAELDLATLTFPNYDADTVAEFLGTQGRIALEVHDSDPRLAAGRWGNGAACRWRNIRVKQLS
jgi:hypothetical protein